MRNDIQKFLIILTASMFCGEISELILTLVEIDMLPYRNAIVATMAILFEVVQWLGLTACLFAITSVERDDDD